ncbi:MAG: hypothetical protein NTZ33_00640 [Bacteroidetes bacterium]|nr:hypothetical protein [Bacteroidota bacterium]
MKTFEIKLKKGLGEISFGDAPEKVMTVLGDPQEVENLEMDEDNVTIISHYLDKDLALFFINSRKPCLECIESSNRDTTLFGKKVFLMNECEIIDLMRQNGFETHEIEDEIWGEKRLTFEDAMIDFYFDDKQLSVISWGVLVDEL